MIIARGQTSSPPSCRSSFSVLPRSLRASSPLVLLLLLLLPPTSSTSSFFSFILLLFLLPLSPFSSSSPQWVPYARVIITAAIRHASLATLCPGEFSRRGTTIARGSALEYRPTMTMTREQRDIARCYRRIFFYFLLPRLHDSLKQLRIIKIVKVNLLLLLLLYR